MSWWGAFVKPVELRDWLYKVLDEPLIENTPLPFPNGVRFAYTTYVARELRAATESTIANYYDFGMLTWTTNRYGRRISMHAAVLL